MLWLCLQSCITITGPSALEPRPCQHRYCRPICIAPTDPSVPSRWAPACGGGALGTPSPSLPSSVLQGAVWAGEWVVGSCCSRWLAGPDHGTTRNEGCVHPPVGAICRSWL